MASNVPSGAAHLELRDYLRILQRRKLVIIIVTAVCTAAALVLSFLQTPLYAATAKILIQKQSLSTGFEQSSGRITPDLAGEIEQQFFNGQAVRDLARDRLGFPANASASVVGRGAVLQVRAVSPDAQRAAEIANAYAQAYIDARREGMLREYLATAEAIQGKVADLDAKIEELDAQLARLSSNSDRDGQATEAAGLRVQRDSLITQKAALEKSLDEVEVGADLARGGGPEIVAPATPPERPFRPNPPRDALGGLFLGVLLGVAAALLLEYLDDSIKGEADLAAATGGAPVLAVIPRVPDWRNRSDAMLVSLEHPSSPTAEAYRTLRTSVQFAGLDRPLRTLQVTSPRSQDGKSTTATNLAVALARAGQRVILIDCDLRRPRVHDFFGLSNAVGFTSVLVGDVPLVNATQAVPGLDRLRVLASGPTPADPSELLSTRRAVELINSIKEACDIVVIDTPPVLPVSDALVLSDVIDAVIVVVAAGSTTKKETQRAFELLRQVDAPVIGVVMNAGPTERGYGYGYGYSSELDRRQPRSARRARRVDGNGHRDHAERFPETTAQP
ncbi:polysaccharide biosynthesis tyrosine autokinase [Rhabdothermincola sp.]|uniref:polysaccharide biosynthesis tyrosine autokinase n=1 Tax=Rhabdothermincola sp. TaxID=2820405 RepID=UPI002FE27E3C